MSVFLAPEMIEKPPLLKIKKTRSRPSDSQIAAFASVTTAQVVDALGGRGALSSVIVPVTARPDFGETIAGPAMTAENSPADILASFAAIHHMQAGDILVAGFAGNQSCAVAGDRMIGMLKNAGGVALVTDAAVRDIHGINQLDVPVWATGLTPATPFMTGPGRVGFALNIAGQQVSCGDMVVADKDGVVIVPYDQINQVITALERVQSLETALDKEVADGRITPQAVLEILDSPQTVVTDE